MDQIAVEHHNRSGRTDRCFAAAVIGKFGHGFTIKRPKRIGRGFKIVTGLKHTCLVAFGNEKKRAVGRGHVFEEQGNVERARFGHFIIALPCAVILMPLPDSAIKGGLGVDLVLMHVDLFFKILNNRFDQAGMGAKTAVGFVIGMCGKGGSGDAGFLAPDLFAVGCVNLFGFG